MFCIKNCKIALGVRGGYTQRALWFLCCSCVIRCTGPEQVRYPGLHPAKCKGDEPVKGASVKLIFD